MATTKEQGTEAAVAWTRANGVTPDVTLTATSTDTGSRLSDDERGQRFVGYHTWSVVVGDPAAYAPIAQWEVCRRSYDAVGQPTEHVDAVIAACWAAIESGPIPVVDEVTVLVPEHDCAPVVPRGGASEKWIRKGTRRSTVVFVRGPRGRYVEVRYTWPHSSIDPGAVHVERVAAGSLRADRIMDRGARQVLARPSSTDMERVRAVLAGAAS